MQTTIITLMKWPKVLQMGRKHCGKRRNCSFSFSHSVLKRLVLQTHKNQELFDKVLIKSCWQKDQSSDRISTTIGKPPVEQIVQYLINPLSFNESWDELNHGGFSTHCLKRKKMLLINTAPCLTMFSMHKHINSVFVPDFIWHL